MFVQEGVFQFPECFECDWMERGKVFILVFLRKTRARGTCWCLMFCEVGIQTSFDIS